MRTAECPRCKVLIVIAERVNNRSVLVSKLVPFSCNGPLNALSCLRSNHERISRYLARIELDDFFHIVMNRVERLSAEPEHHVDIAGREKLFCILQTFIDLLTRAEFFVTI